MSVTIRNYPRKPLSDKERTIRETLDRIADDRHCTFVPAGGGLQSAINALGSGGGSLCLEPGTYTGNITIPTTVGSVCILGAGMNATQLTGSVLIETATAVMSDLTIRGTDQAYGLKLYKSNSGPARNYFRHIYVGGTSDNSNPPVRDGNGPTGPGVWLDGAIVNTFEHCTIAYCDGDGLYVNTTDPDGDFSTNVNYFRDCTFNGNGGYGVKLEEGTAGVGGEPTPSVASMLLHSFVGGNIENNDSGEVYVDAAIGIRFQDIDFETGKTISQVFNISASNVTIDNCHGVAGGSGAVARFFLMTCGRGLVRGCRISGNYTNPDVGVFLDGSNFAAAYDNQWWDPLGTAGNVAVTPRWINNRANMKGYSA